MASKRKVAFYIESMVVGGAEKVLIDLVNRLDPNLFDITVIAIFKKSVYSDYEFQFANSFLPHVRYTYLIDNTNKFLYRAFQMAYHRLPKSWFYRLLVREQYDVEVAFYEGLPTEFIATSYQSSRKIAWLHTHQQRLYEHLSPVAIAKSKAMYQRYQNIVGVSQAVVQSFESIMGPMPIQCIYNFLDKEAILQQSKEEVILPLSGPYWITVGRLIPIKGYDRLLRSLGRLKKEGHNFSLLMLGDGTERQALEQLVLDLNLEKDVHFLGNTSNPYPYINQAELFICSSYQEGLSTVVIEAAMLQTYVLTTHCSGMDEILDSDINGTIMDNSEHGLYQGLKRLLLKESKINSLSVDLKIEKMEADKILPLLMKILL